MREGEREGVEGGCERKREGGFGVSDYGSSCVWSWLVSIMWCAQD